jgi:hypothetical protein
VCNSHPGQIDPITGKCKATSARLFSSLHYEFMLASLISSDDIEILDPESIIILKFNVSNINLTSGDFFNSPALIKYTVTSSSSGINFHMPVKP